ncbi:MAG: HAD family hydrolase [Anaerofustis sp.]
MNHLKPVVAIMYDFDKTLCTKDMQEYSFIPNLGMSNDAFWQEATALAENQKMDRILAYMYLMIKKAKANDMPFRRSDFTKLGESIEFFDGVTEWFSIIDQFAETLELNVEHYIISSGLKEFIEGTSIIGAFREVYACEFHYDANGVADWPLLSVNYTGKTQFLFRINKGVLDISNDDALNRYTPEEERRIPFRNMIYIGDGLTDVPCMKLVKVNGGQSIAVYTDKQKVKDLLEQDRVNHIAYADYSAGSELNRLAEKILTQIKINNDLVRLRKTQTDSLK